MTRSHRTLSAAVVIGLAFTAAPAHAVDGVVLIDQNRAMAGNVTPGDAPGFPVSITRGGSYRLSSDLVVPDVDTTGISLETSQPLAIDLNGFSIRGPHFGAPRPACQAVSPGSGILTAFGNSNNVEIRNGAITGMGCTGVLLVGFGNVAQNLRVSLNGSVGIQLSGLISNNVVLRNGEIGITSFDAVVTGNEVNENEAEGILIFEGVVTGNKVMRNEDEGLRVPPGATTFVALSNNLFSKNNSNGVQVVGGVQTGPNLCATALGGGSLCP